MSLLIKSRRLKALSGSGEPADPFATVEGRENVVGTLYEAMTEYEDDVFVKGVAAQPVEHLDRWEDFQERVERRYRELYPDDHQAAALASIDESTILEILGRRYDDGTLASLFDITAGDHARPPSTAECDLLDKLRKELGATVVKALLAAAMERLDLSNYEGAADTSPDYCEGYDAALADHGDDE